MDDYMRPIYMGTALMVEMSDQMVACKDSVKIKQLDTRLSSFAGFFNLLFTVGWSFIERDNNKLYVSMMNLFPNIGTASCSDLGYNFGKFVANLLEAESPQEVFYNSVSSLSS
jgi:hypothetical protein